MRVLFLSVLAAVALLVLAGPAVVASTPVAEAVDGAPDGLLVGTQIVLLGVLLRPALLATAPQDPRFAAQERRRRLIGPFALVSGEAVLAFVGVLELGGPPLAAAVTAVGFLVVACSIRLLDRCADHVAR